MQIAEALDHKIHARVRRKRQHHIGLILAHVIQVYRAFHMQMNVRVLLRERFDGRHRDKSVEAIGDADADRGFGAGLPASRW